VTAGTGGLRRRIGAPAKVNLGLRITGIRPDGHHELESVVAPLDLGDDVVVDATPAAGPSVDLVLEAGAAPAGDVPAGPANLAARAAAAFLERAGLACAVVIRLTKRIPAAAGLGGGSSDAGAVLRALAEGFPGAIEPSALAALALGLGADVPFFLDPRPARVGGIGERVEPLPGVPELALLLVNPGIPLATADVYRAFDALRPGGSGPASAAMAVRLEPLLRDGGSWSPRGRPGGPDAAAALEGLLRNDLEPAAVRLCPPIARLRGGLRAAGAQAVGLSGSGPTLLGVFESAAAAAEARGRFAPPVWARVATTLESR
jgi:4-diphosphocytidyl-2-C-methyl-D-erythritol kinase